MLRKTASMIIPALVGALSAMALVPILSGSPKSAPEPAHARGRAARATARPPRSPDIGAALARANRDRLLQLEQRLDSPQATRGAEAPVPDELIDPDPEARREELERGWRQDLDRHAAEPVDRDWSDRVTPQLASDLATLSEGRFKTVAVRCASSTCTAAVEFPSFAEATDGFGTLLHYNYQVNCATKTVLPPPDDREAPYTVTVLYHDCADAEPPG